MLPGWKSVKPEQCSKCGKIEPCKVSSDGTIAMCKRISEGASKHSKDGEWHFHRLAESPQRVGIRKRPAWAGRGDGNGTTTAVRAFSPPANIAPDWKLEAEQFAAVMTPDLMAGLVQSTGVPATAWATLSVGWASGEDLRRIRAGGAGWNDTFPGGAFVLPERAGDGQTIGLSFRDMEGRKGSPAGSKRGLSVPGCLHQLSGPVLFVEGASDVAACVAMGLAAVGRPSNRGGAAHASIMLDGREVLVVGERDGKPDGAWPGRDGAKAVAQQLSGRWNELVQWTLTPPGVKDVRAWLTSKIAAGLDPADATAMHAAGKELLAAIEAEAKDAKLEKRTQADALVDLAQQDYRLGMSLDGEAFAAPIGGPNVAMMLRGGGFGLRMSLAKSYRESTGKTPSSSGLADAMLTLEGMAQDAPPEPIGLRVASAGEGIVLDLADSAGRVAVVTAAGWSLELVSPVLFRHTALTSAMCEPLRTEPSGLLALRGVLNVDDDAWPLIVGWMVAALMPEIPHPVPMLGGEQGCGKSSAARRLIDLIDPSSAPLRGDPRDAEQWAIAASGSWCVCLDNLSRISPWLSDAICKAVTGDGLVRRKLYTDSEVSVLAFKRCVIITSIDHGALRGDLGDRALIVELQRIPDERRMTEKELDSKYNEMRPRLMGALLSTTAKTLAALPAVKLATMPRMADFARVLAALDISCPDLTGGKALSLFEGQRSRVAVEVLEGDPVGVAVKKLIQARDAMEMWAGNASDLLTAITPPSIPRGWPANGRALTGRLKRLRPALAAVGIYHEPPAESDKQRTHILWREEANDSQN